MKGSQGAWGEYMAPWGVAETLRLGLTDVLLGAGGGYTARIVVYDEGVPRDVGEADALPLHWTLDLGTRLQ